MGQVDAIKLLVAKGANIDHANNVSEITLYGAFKLIIIMKIN